MERSPVPPRLIRFGTFELSLDAGELRKSGIHLKLQDQPMQILFTLLDRPGELVTREELSRRLWPEGTFVDFDHGLNTAIKKLRDVLCDDADTPRYIETIPRKGYRFIAPLVGSEVPPSAIATSRRSGDVHWHWLAAVGLMILLSAIALIFLIFRPRLPLVVKTKQLTFSGDINSWVRSPGDFLPSTVQTDGRRVYYGKLGGYIYSVPVEGGEEARLNTNLRYPTLLHISPDGSKLLVRDLLGSSGDMESRLWVVATNGSAARALGEIEARDAAWSPDGKSIAFAKRSAVYLTHDEGASFQKLFDVPGIASFIRWAPDGRGFRLTVIDPATRVSSLWEGEVGKALRQVKLPFEKVGDVCCGEWTHDGRYFFFRRFHEQRFEYWYIDEGRFTVASRTPVLLTAGALEVTAATASPLGNRVFIIGNQHSTTMFRYELRSRRLSPFMPESGASSVKFSPDGKWMFLLQAWNQQTILWRARADGTEWQQLNDPQLWLHSWRISPDGNQILLMAKWLNTPWRLYLVPSQGGNLQELPIPIASVADPNWTPDGHSIILGQPPRYLAEPDTPRAIYTYNLQTKSLVKLPGSEGWFSPRLSRDGSQVLALSIDQHKFGVLSLASSQWRILAESPKEFLGLPFWSPDQTWAYLAIDGGKGEALIRIRLRDGHREEVLRYRDVTGTLDCWANPSPFNDSDSVLIGCVRPNVNVYSLEMR